MWVIIICHLMANIIHCIIQTDEHDLKKFRKNVGVISAICIDYVLFFTEEVSTVVICIKIYYKL